MFTDLTKYINFKNPLFQFSVFLSIFGLVAFADLIIPTTNSAERTEYIMKFLLTFVTGGVLYFMIRYGFGLTITNPSNFLVSTWIVFLLIHPTNIVWYFPLAVFMIAVGKLFFRRAKQPIFNPAALAIVLTYVVSLALHTINPEIDTLLVSWWGADMFQNITRTIPVLNVIIPVLFLGLFFYYANSFKKIPYALTFFGTFLVLTFVNAFMNLSLDRAFNIVSIMLFNASAFCALVMIPEPKTSPTFQKQQTIIGVIAGIALFIFNNYLAGFPIDPLINTIIVANLATLIAKILSQKPKAPPAAPAPAAPVQPQQPVNQNIQNIA